MANFRTEAHGYAATRQLLLLRADGAVEAAWWPQQKRKIKAECNNGCIQQHKQRPARKHLRCVLFIFHKKVLFYIRHKSRSFGRKELPVSQSIRHTGQPYLYIILRTLQNVQKI